uniref:Uncharacterized protein n=1 Tax=Romanomermis culicivorax TaxID=13658 RepID=A0A915KKB1_ROMCU
MRWDENRKAAWWEATNSEKSSGRRGAQLRLWSSLDADLVESPWHHGQALAVSSQPTLFTLLSNRQD